MYDVVAASYGYTILAGILLAMLKSKILCWYLQLDPDLLANGEYLQMTYNEKEEKTWLAKMLNDLCTLTSDQMGTDDYDILKGLIKRVLKYKYIFPQESFDIADKLVGFFEYPMPTGTDDELTMQRMLVLLLDPDNARSPKLANTEDTNLVTILEELKTWFEQLPAIASTVSYSRSDIDRKFFQDFMTKYKTAEMSFEWLVSASEEILPWWFYHHETVDSTGYKFRSINYATNPKTYFTRSKPDPTNDKKKYLHMRTIPGIPEDRLKAAMIMGSFLTYFFDGGINQLSGAWDNEGMYHARLNYILSNGESQLLESQGCTKLESLSENGVYGIVNKTGRAPFDAPFELVMGAEPALSAQSALALTVDDSNNLVRTIGGADVLDKLWPWIQIPYVKLDKYWAKEFIAVFLNPQLEEKQIPDLPKRQSGLTSSTYNSSTDINKLTQYVSELETESDIFKKSGKDNEVKNRSITIRKVRDKITELKQGDSKDDSPPPDTPSVQTPPEDKPVSTPPEVAAPGKKPEDDKDDE
jgi:predicted DNA binding CopG/RHH family protein